MFRACLAFAIAITLLLSGCASSNTAVSGTPADTGSGHHGPGHNKALHGPSPHDVVVATEQAFARTMADRDFEAFQLFLSDEAIFMSGPATLRGKQSVATAWKPYFESSDAPFSWEPERVVVLDSGSLAFSSGPVHGPDGAEIGIFNSVWRRDKDGVWRIVFDKGGCACN